MTLTGLLETAAASTAKAEFAQVSDAIKRLRATLDAYEVVAWKHAERKVIERVFAALGSAPPEAGVSEKEVDGAREELHYAILALTDAIEPVVATPVAVAPPSEAPPLPKAALARQAPEANSDDVEHAQRLLKEIEELRNEDVRSLNPIRLRPLLQAIAAEARLLIERLPHHPIHRALIDRMSMIVALKHEAGVAEFINGLSHTARGDWVQIAKENRKAVSRFDTGVAEAIEKADSKKKVEKPKPIESVPIKGMKFPLLSAQTKECGPLLLIGGIKVDDKLDIVLRDFGLDCEWIEIPKNAPRTVESTTARIASGKVGVVVILEHFMAHTVYRSLTKACDASNVIYATAGKGGKGALDLAFMSLEGKLQPR